MAYGTKEGNYFKADPNIEGGDKLKNSRYSLVIEDFSSSTPGLISIYKGGASKIGTIPLGGSFTPEEFQSGTLVTTVATPDEIKYFSNSEVVSGVKNQAIITATKAQKDLGVNAEDAEKRSRQLIETGKTEIGTDRDDIDRALEKVELTTFNIESGNRRTEYENLVYPEKLNLNLQDCIKFTIKELTKVTFNPDLSKKSFNKNYSKIEGSVTLPIQPSITDSNAARWGSSEMNAIQSFGVAASISLANSDNFSALIDKVGDIGERALKDMFGKEQYKQAIGLYLAEQAVGAQGLLSRTTGRVLNPNMELLFQGPELRSFTFQFKLSPRSSEEAVRVKKIIRFFKQAMSVKTTSDNVFLKSPFVFDIRYLSNNEDHKSLNRIKTCALLGCDVDYTPDGSYMTFNDADKTMTSYGLSLRFSELEPIYDSDYNQGSGASGTSNIHANITKDEIGF